MFIRLGSNRPQRNDSRIRIEPLVKISLLFLAKQCLSDCGLRERPTGYEVKLEAHEQGTMNTETKYGERRRQLVQVPARSCQSPRMIDSGTTPRHSTQIDTRRAYERAVTIEPMRSEVIGAFVGR